MRNYKTGLWTLGQDKTRNAREREKHRARLNRKWLEQKWLRILPPVSTCTTSVCVDLHMWRRGCIGHGATLFILWMFVGRQRSLRCRWGWGIERQRWNAASFIIIISFFTFVLCDVGYFFVRSVSLRWRNSLVCFGYFFSISFSHYFPVVFPKSLCNLLRVKSIFRGLLLSWSMFCWFGCYSRSSFSVSSSTSLRNSLMSSSHLFFGLPIALSEMYFDLNSGFHSAAFINHLSLNDVAILIAGLPFIDCESCSNIESSHFPSFLRCERVVLGKSAKVLISWSAQGICPPHRGRWC